MSDMDTTLLPEFATDNRWAAGGSGANIREHCLAAYAGRWIDYGTYGDVVGDRQGYAYSDSANLETLQRALVNANISRVGIAELPRDETVVRHLDKRVGVAMRRAGGYIYVDAWLLPDVDMEKVCHALYEALSTCRPWIDDFQQGDEALALYRELWG